MTALVSASSTAMHVASGGTVLAANTSWYVTRGAGIATLAMLTASILLGVLASMDLGVRRLPGFVTAALHRNVSLLALVFLGLHIVTTVADGYAPIRWVDTVVPFIGSYHPLALGLGAVAFDLMLAITISSLLRAHIAAATWRWVHLSAYLCWPIALVHGLLMGTDRGAGWMLLFDLACTLPVAAAVIARSVQGRRRTAGRLRPVTASQTTVRPTVTRGARR